jgi:hypothetical protein
MLMFVVGSGLSSVTRYFFLETESEVPHSLSLYEFPEQVEKLQEMVLRSVLFLRRGKFPDLRQVPGYDIAPRSIMGF